MASGPGEQEFRNGGFEGDCVIAIERNPLRFFSDSEKKKMIRCLLITGRTRGYAPTSIIDGIITGYFFIIT